MKTLATFLAVFALVGLTSMAVAVDEASLWDAVGTTVNNPSPDQEPCDSAVKQQWDDGIWNNGIIYRYGGVVGDPDWYGSFAECYTAEYVCTIEYAFATLQGLFLDQTMWAFVWEHGVDDNPGNIICMIPDVHITEPAYWPSGSLHLVDVFCCVYDVDPTGAHFVGFWPNWPDALQGWFVLIDSDGGYSPCPRVKSNDPAAMGWVHPDVIWGGGGIFTASLGIREWYLDYCPGVTATEPSTWGAIKTLY
jgi:hypothetical protein